MGVTTRSTQKRTPPSSLRSQKNIARQSPQSRLRSRSYSHDNALYRMGLRKNVHGEWTEVDRLPTAGIAAAMRSLRLKKASSERSVKREGSVDMANSTEVFDEITLYIEAAASREGSYMSIGKLSRNMRGTSLLSVGGVVPSVENSNAASTEQEREMIKAMKAEYEKYVNLGKSLKHQRDALHGRSQASRISGTVLREAVKKANIMGVESLLAYHAGFEALDHVYEVQGGRHNGEHWRSMFPYLDHLRKWLKSGAADERSKVVLDIVASLVGYSAATRLPGPHNAHWSKAEPDSRDGMLALLRGQAADFKRREVMLEGYHRGCREVSKWWPEMVTSEKALGWINTPEGEYGDGDDVKGRLSAIVHELCKDSEVEWKSKLDF